MTFEVSARRAVGALAAVARRVESKGRNVTPVRARLPGNALDDGLLLAGRVHTHRPHRQARMLIAPVIDRGGPRRVNAPAVLA